MFVRLLVLFVGIDIIQFGDACSKLRVGGWQANSDSTLQNEMVTLARQQLKATSNLASEPIQVVSFETQVVAGTNLRLKFIVNEQQKCTLQAFKPLPYTKKPTEIKSFNCDNIT